MKYRHAHHAGNFADVHKHVTLLALLAALQRKEKGLLYLETHAGRGVYDLGESAAESRAGIARLEAVACEAPELRHYLDRVAQLRRAGGSKHLYPGSPWLAASALRAQDRGVLVEALAEEARALERALGPVAGRVRIETGDGFARLRAELPPVERRALILIDPPYEETREDFERVRSGLTEALRRFATGVVAIWYPIKHARDTDRWLEAVGRELDREALVSQLWLHPCDSRVALNGSGLLIVNPPYQLDERMSQWLPELYRCLRGTAQGGCTVQPLTPARA